MSRYFYRPRTLIERDEFIGVKRLEKDLKASRWLAWIDGTNEVVA